MTCAHSNGGYCHNRPHLLTAAIQQSCSFTPSSLLRISLPTAARMYSTSFTWSPLCLLEHAGHNSVLYPLLMWEGVC